MAVDPNIATPPLSTNDLTGAGDRARVGGSTFTVFTWQASPIAFARQIATQSQTPVGPGTVPIHPLDSPYPTQLITPMALTMGSISLEMYELFGQQVWERLAGLDSAASSGGVVDLANIFVAVNNTTDPIVVTRVVRPPKIRGRSLSPYTLEYHNCVVSTLEDGETIEVGTMEVLKRLTINYTHTTRGGKNGLLATASGPWASTTGTSFQ